MLATQQPDRWLVQVAAVELSADLADLARTSLAGHDFHAVTVAFEDWPLPDQRFDLVVAATAWHWLDPHVRMTRTPTRCGPAAPWQWSPPTTSRAGHRVLRRRAVLLTVRARTADGEESQLREYWFDVDYGLAMRPE